jgi:predicted KAP-like P-loop ATPase
MSTTRFRSDRPIEQSAQDALERADFARRLALNIQAWDGSESLVIGIHGDWGSGKSSVKNLVLERLGEFGDQSPRILHFNPWMISGEQHVADAFFLETELVLAEDKLGQDGKKRAVAWRKYARHFETLAKLSTAVDVALPFVGALPGVGKLMAERLREGAGLAEQAASSLEGKTKTIDEQRVEVRELFKKLSRKLVIVIDDLDRLTDEEIRVMFRIVKATADFPNTVFLLLFQKSTVAKALDPICGGQGEVFLQKIVQVELGLPALPPNKLAGFWEEGVTELVGREFITELNANGRLLKLWLDGLQCYFRNLRDVTRFLNSFGFMASGFRKDGVWEVNVLDLMVVEALRLFDPEVFRIVANHKSQLTGQSHDTHGNKMAELARDLLAGRNTTLLTESQFKDLMGELFPALQGGWSNMSYSDSYQSAWTREKRVCIERFFDLYFRLSLPSGQLSETVVAGILAIKSDREALRGEIRLAQDNGTLFEILERLEAEEDFIADPSMAYVLALSDLCDNWDRTPGGMMASWPGSLYAHRAAYRLLRRIQNPQQRAAALIRLIRETEGLLIAGDWIEDSTKEETKMEWPSVRGDAATELKTEWLERVRACKDEAFFVRIKGLPRLLRLWGEWSDYEEVCAWFANFPKAEIGPVLESLVSTSTSSSGYKTTTTRWLSWKALERYGDRNFWDLALAELEANHEQSGAGSIINLLRESLVRWDEGKDDTDSWCFREDE